MDLHPADGGSIAHTGEAAQWPTQGNPVSSEQRMAHPQEGLPLSHAATWEDLWDTVLSEIS